MKVYDTADIRNLAIVGHGDAGKTTLTAALMYVTQATESLGAVTEGTALTDFDPDEVERQVSMSVAAATTEWNGRKLNLLDAPGYPSFIGDAAAALRGADAIVIVVHGVDGIGVQTEKMWDDAEKLGLPVLFVVSQLDRERADFQTTLSALVERFGRQVCAVSLPIGQSGSLEGVVRLVTGKAYRPKNGTPYVETGDPPEEMAEAVRAAQEQLFDLVTESDDALMEVYLEQGELNAEQLSNGLRNAIASRALFPVFAGSGTNLAGVHALADGLADFAPSPAQHSPVSAQDDKEQEVTLQADSSGPLVAQAIKTYIDPFAGRITLIRLFSGSASADQSAWNASRSSSEKLSGLSAPRGKSGVKIGEAKAGDIVMVSKLKDTHTGDTIVADKSVSLQLAAIPFPTPVISYAVKAEGKGEEEKIATGLQRLAEEDPTIRLERDARTHELMLAGLGMNHVRIVLEKLQRRFSVKAVLEKPKVPYLETITKTAKAVYRHKKQTGGAGQFAEVHLRVEALPRGTGFEYDSEIFGGAISRNFWPSIEKGIRQVLVQGVIAGYPMVDVKAVVFDGKEHPVDSKDIAFQVAGRESFKTATKDAGPVVLEPIMRVAVSCPDENMGDILGDLNRRRGKVQGSDSLAGRAMIRAEVPMSEMLEYDATLRSLTSGRGSYTMELDHYEKVPYEIQQKLMEEFKPQETED